MRIPILPLPLLALCAACSGYSPDVPSAGTMAAQFPQYADQSQVEDKLRTGDRLSIRVLGEPEITGDSYRVDSTGSIQMPLAGEIQVADLTLSQARAQIVRRLAAGYIRDPQVSVGIVERLRTTFTVEGQVRDPGSYEVAVDTTLLKALAAAKSPNDVARLNEVVVFRTVEDKRLGARFDVEAIRAGRAYDPQILAGDIIVVGFSTSKGLLRDFLKAVPVFNVFTQF